MNPNRLLNKIKTEFPELTWTKFKHLNTGFDHDVVILDKSLVFRFPKSKEYQKIIAKEAASLLFLSKRTRASIPQQLFLSKDKTFAGYTFISGQELDPVRFKRFPTKEKNEIAKQLAEFLTVLHSIPKKDLVKLGIRIQDSKKDFSALVRNTKKYIFPKLKPVEIKRIEAFFKELNRAIKKSSPKAFVHDDLTWDHLFWDRKKQRLGVIDFSDSVYDDPASDFKGLWKLGEGFVNLVYDLYQGKKDDELLYRSRLYLKRIPLYVMKAALIGNVCDFEEGYEKFKIMFD